MTQTTGQPRYKGPTLPRIAALYCRVSSNRQGEDDKTSLKTQLAALKKLAADLGWGVDDRYIYEDCYTGEELHQRPALAQLRQDAKTRVFGLVLAYNVYALAKNQAHMAILLDEWEHIGIGLDFATEKLENTPLGRLILDARAFATEVDGERRRDRMHRALLAQVQAGKPATGSRPPYGYDWPEERDRRGRLTKTHLIQHPETWPIVQRIWSEALAGRTTRAIALGLTNDGIPTPSGQAAQWDPVTVRTFLTNPLYWGKPMALRRMLVKVPPHLRKHYAHMSRAVTRPIEEQIPLPADYAPAVVSPEVAARVQTRLALNKQLATPQNPNPQELLRGIAHCGYCHYTLIVRRSIRRPNVASRHYKAKARTTYICGKGNRLLGFPDSCEHHGIEAHKLDGAVWAAIKDILTHPEVIEQELERMRERPDPADDTLAAIDHTLADLRRRIKNKRAYAEQVDEPREMAEVAAEVKLLRQQEEKLEAERVATLAHYANWREEQEGFQQTLDWCARVGANLDSFTYDERRATLFTLKAEIDLWRTDHTPRAELTIHLPLSGARSLDLTGLISVHGDEHAVTCCKLTR